MKHLPKMEQIHELYRQIHDFQGPEKNVRKMFQFTLAKLGKVNWGFTYLPWL
jgi:hypothetical protein